MALAAHHQAGEAGVPEYMVSYADMLTILLAFFIVLYATTGTTSDGKDKGEKAGRGAAAGQDPKGPHQGAGPKDGPGGKEGVGPYEKGGGKEKEAESAQDAQRQRELNKVFESLYLRFGPDWTLSNCWIGGPPELRQATMSLPKRGSGESRSSRGLRGYNGDDPFRARAPRSGENLLVAGRIYFEEFSADLPESQRAKLQRAIDELAGKMQRIEIRGHTSRRPLPAGSPFRDHWELAFARCRKVMEYLVSGGIDRERIRLGVAAENEPLDLAGDPWLAKHSSRVEIHWLNEYVKAPAGVRDKKPPADAKPTRPTGTSGGKG